MVAEYAFLGKADYKRVTSHIGESAWPKVYDALQHVLDGIRSGVFVARPEKSQFRLSFVPCEYCDPDHLGTAERWTQFERKLADPRVAGLLGEPGNATPAPTGHEETVDG